MNVLSWNCRGLGNPCAIPNLKFLIRRYKSDVLFLYETISYSNKIDELRYILSYGCSFAVDRVGRGRGIVVFWQKPANCVIQNYSRNHIDIIVNDTKHDTWRLTGFYGYPELSNRRTSWNLMRHLSESSNLPRFTLGDFNDILSSKEKKGRIERPNWLINVFRHATKDAGLSDISMEGYLFTWFKSLGTNRAIEKNLDRDMANNDWCFLFPNAKEKCLTTTTSNHYPILLQCENATVYHRAQVGFRFENAWLVKSGFGIFVIEQWWSFENDHIVSKLENCGKHILT